jgi:hypothetical protein
MANDEALQLKLTIDHIPMLTSSEDWQKQTAGLQEYAQSTALRFVNSKLDEYDAQYDKFSATLESYRRDRKTYLKSRTDDNSFTLLRCKAQVDSQFNALRDTVKVLQIHLATFANDMARRRPPMVTNEKQVRDQGLELNSAASMFATLERSRFLDVDIEKYHVDHSADLPRFTAPLVSSPPRSGSLTPTDPTTPTDSTRSLTPTPEAYGNFRNPRPQPQQRGHAGRPVSPTPGTTQTYKFRR